MLENTINTMMVADKIQYCSEQVNRVQHILFVGKIVSFMFFFSPFECCLFCNSRQFVAAKLQCFKMRIGRVSEIRRSLFRSVPLENNVRNTLNKKENMFPLWLSNKLRQIDVQYVHVCNAVHVSNAVQPYFGSKSRNCLYLFSQSNQRLYVRLNKT